MTSAATWAADVPWLGGRPARWNVCRLKYLCRLSSRTNTSRSDALLSLSAKRGVIPKKYGEDAQVRSGFDLEHYWSVAPNQLIVNPMWLAQGAIACAEISGVISPDYRVYNVGPRVDPRFVHHVLRSREYRSLYELFVRGDTTYDRRVSKEDFTDIPVLLPPLDEQRRIAKLLDDHARRVLELISLKESQLAASEERYIAILSQLTDPHVARAEKSSTRLGSLIREVKRPVSLVPTETYREVGVRSHGRGLFEKDPVLGSDLEDKGVYRIEAGDLVFNIVFAWEGAVAAAYDEHSGLVGSHRFPTYRAVGGIVDLRFLAFFFKTPYGRFLLEQNSPGAAGRNKTLDRWSLLREKVGLPDLETQRRLGDELDDLGRASVAVRQEIELLNELRGSVVSAVLKGQSKLSEAVG